MKNFSLLLLLICLCSQGIAQSDYSDEFRYKVVYQLTYQPDSTDASSVTSEEMWLYMGEEISKFSSKGKALKDSLYRTKNLSGAGMPDFKARAELTRTEFGYAVFKDIPKNKISYTLKILRDELRYEEDKGLFEWEILPETRTIQGYESQKAKTVFRGREYTAWFTTEIPISDGPYKFSGLPGLILQLSDSENHYVFEIVQFQSLEEPLSLEFSMGDYTLTSREKLLQLKKEYEEDPFAALDNANRGSTKKVTIEISPQQKREHLRKIQKELERKNNPIELE
ncbi:hypothetical protein GCM10007103_31850 [Salinimicrobium marinum]|uniref:GLPGLI family protein n=1 Tax=Salinimicrobium marinum TaxID=680283 RepID=A0A918W1A3_9FLAO|nr:GLPGLI family protein [Salinimicrobium marinum]GHA48564.1 hypothetical protein GCM10007103_31850 [Salinimicrobium marinum]